MATSNKKSLLILPSIHLLLAVIIFLFVITSPDLARHDMWRLLVVIDWPISTLLGKVTELLQAPIVIQIFLLVIIGTLWWYILSWVLYKMLGIIKKE